MPLSSPAAHTRTRAGLAIIVGIAITIVAPVTLFTFANFEVSLTLLLAPLAGLCLMRAPALLRNLFLACIAAGLTSIGLASFALDDHLSLRYFLSLGLVLTSPLYFFLGFYLCSRYYDFQYALSVLAVVASISVVIITIHVIVAGDQVRWYVGAQGLTVLNVTLLGLPLYGSFGVLSLASLFVLHMFVIGAAFAAATRRWEQYLLVSGFAAATFLVTGSNARSAHLVLPYVLLALGLAAAFGRRRLRVRAAVLLAVGILSVVYSSSRMVLELRIVTTAREMLGLPTISEVVPTKGGPPSSGAAIRRPSLEEQSTGRKSLLEDAVREIALSPAFGNGFASYNRIDRNVSTRSRLSGNRTTHVHYVTILWKGGVLFFVPYMALLGGFWLYALRGSWPEMSAGVAFLLAGLVFVFVVLSLFWDILLVPSAGAYAFFLLGAITQSRRRDRPTPEQKYRSDRSSERSLPST